VRISHLSFPKEIHSRLAILRLKLVSRYDGSEETTMNGIGAQGTRRALAGEEKVYARVGKLTNFEKWRTRARDFS
jgi:hypothetical protein